MITDERKRLWRDRGLKKIETLGFIAEDAGRTLGQAAIQFILAEPSVVTVLPNIYDRPQLEELAGAPETTPMSEAELDRLGDLYINDFYLDDIPQPAVA